MSRLKIHHLREAGLSHPSIAAAVGCGESTVRRVLDQPPPTAAEVVADRLGVRGPGAPSKTAAFADRIVAALADRPALPTVELLRQAQEWGYQGGVSAFFALVKRLRPAATPVEPLVRFDGLPAEFAQFDFGEINVVFGDGDGAPEKVHFFVGRLTFSRLLHVEVTVDQKAERLARATVACLAAFGGAPKQWVYDNPKTVFVDRPGGGTTLHPYLRQLTAELNCLVERCAPRRGNQKGAVENAVGFVKKNFFLPGRFADRSDLVAQLADWLRRVNCDRPCAATGEIPAQRWEQERLRLAARPVPWPPDEFPLRESAVVSPTGTVRFKGTAYSVDPRYLGAPATLRVLARRLVIEVGRSRCEHARSDFSDEVRRLPEHSLALAAVITASRKQTYFKRQCLMELGPVAQRFLDRLIMRAPGNAWYADIHRLFDFYQQHAHEALLAAMAGALADGRSDIASVLRRLKGVG
jgi:transposase